MNTTNNGLHSSQLFKVAPRIWGKRDAIVNFFMIQNQHSDDWLLVDTGLKWSAPKIKKMAHQLFGKDSKPSAILLTHGHFDHIGSLRSLIKEWNVPVYAHSLEIPYLTGKSSYPPPDPMVGGGLMAGMAWLYPSDPIDIHDYIEPLPDDGTIPGFEEWRYIHTPGHAPGHISLFREQDKVLLPGDAFVTTRQESAWHVMLQIKELCGPPKYFTYDWDASGESVRKLADLEPEIVASGHGKPMHGEELRRSLRNLARNFEVLAVPSHGRYTREPALTDTSGVVYVPPKKEKNSAVPVVLGAIAGLVTAAIIVYRMKKTAAA